MRYVDDLSEVKPEEIEHIDDGEVISITIIPDADAKSNSKVVVCFRYTYSSYTIDGRFCRSDKQKFIYKSKKTRYVKSMEQILSECTSYTFDDSGCLFVCYLGTNNICIPPASFSSLGKPHTDSHCWSNWLLEEREIEEDE